MRRTLLLCLLVIVCTGCPEPPTRGRIVSLIFPPSMSDSTLALTTSDAQIHEALQIIDDTLVSDGFVRDSQPPDAGAPGFVASYSKFDSEGRVRRRPLVWLQGGRLLVALGEGRVPGPVGADIRNTVNQLETELIKHYGKKRVRVERPST